MRKINISQARKERKKGETLVNISLSTLNEFFPENAPIRVSRKWLEVLGFSIDKPPETVQISVVKEKEGESVPLFKSEDL